MRPPIAEYTLRVPRVPTAMLFWGCSRPLALAAGCPDAGQSRSLFQPPLIPAGFRLDVLVVTRPTRQGFTMHQTYPTPTSAEQRAFLISFLFGGEVNPGVSQCVARAYLDLSRTAHGISKEAGANQLKRDAHLLAKSLLTEAIGTTKPWTPSAFDRWHEAACSQVCAHYRVGRYPMFRVGQAQKWLNMSIKYALSLSALEMLHVVNLRALRRVAHVPLDNIVIEALRSFNAPRLRCPWSRIADYGEYLRLQHWIRKQFKESLPLDVEFHIWIKESARQRSLLQT